MGVYVPNDDTTVIVRLARLAGRHFDECKVNGRDSARAVAMREAYHRLEKAWHASRVR